MTMPLLAMLLFPFIGHTRADSIPAADMSAMATHTFRAGKNPDFIAVDGNDAWVVDDHQSAVFKISDQGKIIVRVAVPQACTAPIYGYGYLWVMSCTGKSLYKIDHRSGTIAAVIPTGMADSSGEMSLSATGGFIWLLSDSTGVLSKVDPRRNSIVKQIAVQPFSYGSCSGFGAIWISNYRNNSVQSISLVTDTVSATIAVGKHPRFITAGENGVWTLNQGDGTVSRIDPLSKKMVAGIDVAAKGGGGDIAAGAGKIWVVSTNPQRPVQLIDPRTNSVQKIYRQAVNGRPAEKVDGAVRAGRRCTWVTGYHSSTVWQFRNRGGG
jgi:virginiamycin B lyase